MPKQKNRFYCSCCHKDHGISFKCLDKKQHRREYAQWYYSKAFDMPKWTAKFEFKKVKIEF